MAEQRIVSLLPATTEILYWLGAGPSVVGVTYECTEPADAQQLPHVTDTIIPDGATPAEIDALISAAIAEGKQLYTLDEGLLRDLDPSLIVTQDLCRVCALPAGSVADALRHLSLDSTVFSYDPMTLDEVVDSIEALGIAVGAPETNERVAALRDRLATLRASAPPNRPKVLMLEWPDPPYTPGHWIPDQIEAAGGEPLLAHPGGRSSATSWDEIAACEADVVIVAPCGFDEAAARAQLDIVTRRPDLAGMPALVNGRTYAIDADAYVVRPGPRLVDGVEELRKLIHP